MAGLARLGQGRRSLRTTVGLGRSCASFVDGPLVVQETLDDNVILSTGPNGGVLPAFDIFKDKNQSIKGSNFLGYILNDPERMLIFQVVVEMVGAAKKLHFYELNRECG